MTPENKVRSPVLKWAKKHGVVHIRQSFARGGRAGWPDDLFVFNGYVAFVEFKAAGKVPTPLQDQRMEELANVDALVEWFDDADAAIAWLERALEVPSVV